MVIKIKLLEFKCSPNWYQSEEEHFNWFWQQCCFISFLLWFSVLVLIFALKPYIITVSSVFGVKGNENLSTGEDTK